MSGNDLNRRIVSISTLRLLNAFATARSSRRRFFPNVSLNAARLWPRSRIHVDDAPQTLRTDDWLHSSRLYRTWTETRARPGFLKKAPWKKFSLSSAAQVQKTKTEAFCAICRVERVKQVTCDNNEHPVTEETLWLFRTKVYTSSKLWGSFSIHLIDTFK